MNNAIRQIISIANSDLTIIEHRGERVVTLAMVDQVHQRPDGTARKRLNDNRARFTEGKHVFKVCASEFRTHNPGVISNKSHEDVILLTQRGYLLLVKSFTDELSWQVQDMLVDGYFDGQRQQAPQPANARISNHRLRLSLAKELYRTRDPELRKIIHQQLADVSDALSLPVPGLDSLGYAAPAVPDVLAEFWAALAVLDQKGVAYDHASNANVLAINLPEISRLLIEHGHPLRVDNALKQALWQSPAPRCLRKNHPVTSQHTGKSVRCWVFEKQPG